jgi:hypothetical protein
VVALSLAARGGRPLASLEFFMAPHGTGAVLQIRLPGHL